MKPGLRTKNDVMAWLGTQPVPVAALKPSPRNARKHSEHQITKLIKSIQRFGFINPIVIDQQNEIVAGHGRLLAARRMGLETVPAIRLDHLNEAQLRAYRIADNRLAELAEWDQPALAEELEKLLAEPTILDATDTGFELPEIDAMVHPRRRTRVRANVRPDVDEPAISRPGDMWELGSHRVLCGDVRDAATLARLMGEDRAAAVICRPADLTARATSEGDASHAQRSSELNHLLQMSLQNLVRVSRSAAPQFIWSNWEYMHALLDFGRTAYGALVNLCIWVKETGDSRRGSDHELIFEYRARGAPQERPNPMLRKVWTCPGEADHSPAVIPVAMLSEMLRACTSRRDVVLDGFSGAGATLLAAEHTGRIARALDLNPHLVDLAIRRWEAATGRHARHAETGMRFDVLGAERRSAVS
jgi:ParB-like chromosome segregation protein Spo0J